MLYKIPQLEQVLLARVAFARLLAKSDLLTEF